MIICVQEHVPGTCACTRKTAIKYVHVQCCMNDQHYYIRMLIEYWLCRHEILRFGKVSGLSFYFEYELIYCRMVSKYWTLSTVFCQQGIIDVYLFFIIIILNRFTLQKVGQFKTFVTTQSFMQTAIIR